MSIFPFLSLNPIVKPSRVPAPDADHTRHVPQGDARLALLKTVAKEHSDGAVP
jgi:hypothetical protein